MQLWSSLSEIPTDLGPTVVTLGSFDGVHGGHKAVLHRTVERARAAQVASVAVTFSQHPLQVLRPEQAPELITSVAQRVQLLAALDLTGTLILPFTQEFAATSAEDFVVDFLVHGLHAQHVVLGKDSRFGAQNGGNIELLTSWGLRHGFTVEQVPDLVDADRPGRKWSSTVIRELLAAGKVGSAARALGRPHRVSGEVVHGDHRGRELGYPTANLSEDAQGMIPADGVYAGWLLRPSRGPEASDRVLPAAISIGTNPTFNGVNRRVEAYVLDRTDLELYGEEISLELVRRLRPTEKFDSVPDLVAQMARDVAQCREVLATIVPTGD